MAIETQNKTKFLIGAFLRTAFSSLRLFFHKNFSVFQQMRKSQFETFDKNRKKEKESELNSDRANVSNETRTSQT